MYSSCGERGEVDGVLDDAELEVVADLHGELDADGLLGLVGGAGDVRGEDDVVEVEEGRVLEGLLVEDVEGGAGDVAGLDGVGEGLFDDELAAGAVDDADALLHDARWRSALMRPSVWVVRPTWRVR